MSDLFDQRDEALEDFLKNIEGQIDDLEKQYQSEPKSERKELVAKSQILVDEVSKANRMSPEAANNVYSTEGQYSQQFPESASSIPNQAKQTASSSLESNVDSHINELVDSTKMYTSKMFSDWVGQVTITSFILPFLDAICKIFSYTFYYLLKILGIKWGEKQVLIQKEEDKKARIVDQQNLDAIDPKGVKDRGPIMSRTAINTPEISEYAGKYLAWGVLGAAVAGLIWGMYQLTNKFINYMKSKKVKAKSVSQEEEDPKEVSENAFELLKLEKQIELLEMNYLSEISLPKAPTKEKTVSYIIKKIDNGQKWLGALALKTEYGARSGYLYSGFVKANHTIISMGVVFLTKAKAGIYKATKLGK